MNRILLCCLLALFSSLSLSAQTCEPDMIYADSSFGVYPKSIEESACINQPYSYSLTFVIPEQIMANGITANVDSIVLSGVTGLPTGLAYACNPPICVFTPEDELACANIYGTAEASNTPDEYELILDGTVYTDVLDLDFATLFPLLGVENYKITLEEENSGTCLVNTEEPLNEQVRIETSPNPFSFETNIFIFSERVSETLELEVFTMLGDRVYAQTINLAQGTNVIPFDGSRLAEGVYFFNFSDGNSSLTQKMIIAR